MNWFKPKRIFLDYASATPLRSEVALAMQPYWEKDFYNPSAIYAEGQGVRDDLEKFRIQIAQMMGANKNGVIFTSGGTQANTWAVRGLNPKHVIVDALSHPSVLESTQGLETSIWQSGEPMPLREDTTLVSSLTTDNKLGRQLRDVRRESGGKTPLLHIDATQSAQYFKVGLETLACDLITLDAGKLYGPKGVGALIVRKGVELDLPPLGTPPMPLIAGLVKALELAVKDRELESKRLRILTEKFVAHLKPLSSKLQVMVEPPNTVLVSAPGILPELLVLALEREGILVSAGPACNANKPEPPETPVRFSFGRGTTEREVEKAAKKLCLIVQNMVK